MKSRIFLLLMATLLFTITANAQELPVEQTIGHFLNQTNLFPQEKIHLHTDRPNYISGDRIWLRAYVVNALSHEPMELSRYVYVELVNPLGVVVKRVMVRNSGEGYSGYIDIPEDLADGNYTLRAYTHFMQNLAEEYFHRSPVTIAYPEVMRYDITPSFRAPGKDRMEVTLTLKPYGEQKFRSRSFDIKIAGQPVSLVRVNSDTVARFTVKLEEGAPRILYVGYENYRKYFHIPYNEGEFDVTFHPEGGNLIAGKVNRVAYKAIHPDGSPVDFTGTVRDRSGSALATFQSVHDGMGTFTIECREDEAYTVECETDAGFTRRYQLPTATSATASLSLVGNNEGLTVNVIRGAGLSSGPLYLLGHSRGYPFYFAEVENGTAEIPITGLPEGVLQFLLLDPGLNILSERLFYCMNGSETATLNISTDKPSYDNRALVRLGLQLDDENPAPASLSVSVTDDSDLKGRTILSIAANLLLKTEIRGYVHEPDQYFLDQPGDGPGQIDLVMLTNGWRRYDIPQVLKGNYAEPVYPLEVGQEISGSIRGLVRKRPVPDSEVSIISPKRSFYAQTFTDDDGRYYLRNFEYPDSTEFVVQALNPKGKDNVELLVDEISFPTVDVRFNIPRSGAELSDDYIRKSDRKFVLEHGMRLIDIEGITVQGHRVEQQKGFMSDMADASFTLSDIEELDATCLHELVRRVPGVEMRNEQLYIRGSHSIYADNPVAIYIDGVHVSDDFDLHMIQMPDVARVDIFKTGSTNVFGAKGGAGVLSITTKNGKFMPSEIPKYNIQRITPLGYQTPAQFYSPKYDTAERRNDATPDLRTTIHWEPVVRTDENGAAHLEFYSADYITNYTIYVEGLTDDGKIISSSSAIKIE